MYYVRGSFMFISIFKSLNVYAVNVMNMTSMLDVTIIPKPTLPLLSPQNYNNKLVYGSFPKLTRQTREKMKYT